MAPVGLVPVPVERDRSVILDQIGLVYLLDGAELRPEPFLDIRDRVVELVPEYDERGLLAIAFHPQFADNGRVFVYYSAPVRAAADPGVHDHTNRLSEFSVVLGEMTSDAASERIILEFEQPQAAHSGGALGFGPDGYLYLGAGDGGGTGDDDPGHSAQGNAQDLSRLNGKILRIDVNGREPYTIPPDNPFADGSARREIYAYGLRNPWRMSWEPGGERRLLAVDPGWGLYEEVNVVVPGGNYGWRIREGNHCVNRDEPLQPLAVCPTSDAGGDPLRGPVVEYTHAEVGVAVVGGYVYRGSALPALRGQYVFGDFSAQRPTGDLLGGLILAAEPGATDELWRWRRLELSGGLGGYLTGIGEDAAGELYVMVRAGQGSRGQNGRVFRIVPATSQ